MAELSDNVGLQTVAPRIQAPDDYQRISTNPEQFGAGIGQSIHNVGDQDVQLAQKSIDFYNEVAANDATNKLQEGSNKILYGDPSKQVMGPDGTMQPDTGYRGLRGAAAMDQRAAVTKQLDDLTAQITSNLPNAKAKEQFQTESRRYRFAWEQQIGTHAEEQQRTWENSVREQTSAVARNTIGAAPEDDAAYAQGLHTMLGAYIKQAQSDGTDVGEAAMRAQQDATIIRIRALKATNPSMAQRVLNQNRGNLAGLSGYDALSQEVGTAVVAQRSTQMADALSNPLHPFGAPVDLKTAILGQESGGNDNVATSATGAVGPMQIEPDTFKQYARPGEVITNPKDNRTVGNRIIDTLSQKYNGDAARIATAYFSGDGNVAPPGSATPWKRDAADKTGKKTSSYVQDVLSRTGRANTDTNPYFADLTPLQQSEVMDKAVGEMHRRLLEQRQIDAATDDPAKTTILWHGINQGQVTAQQIIDGERNGYITAQTGAEMVKAIDNGPKRTAVEKDAFDTLKSALSGGAIDQGVINIFPEADRAKAKQNWTEAQAEWSRRTLKGEDPRAVLNDMVPRYAPAIQHPTWLEPLQFGVPNTAPDVNNIAVQTYKARQAGQIDQKTYDQQVSLLNQYKVFYTLRDRQIAAQNHAKGKVVKPSQNQGGVTVSPEANP